MGQRRFLKTSVLYCFLTLLLKVFPSVATTASGGEGKEYNRQTPVFAPVVAGATPTNESTIVTLSNGEHRIFYINRPGEANRLMSVRSADGLHWSEPVTETELPGTAYYANRVLVDDKGLLHCIFHLWAEGANGYRGRHLDLWYMKKKAGSDSWEKPRKIYDGYVGSLRCFMQLESGRLLTTFGRAVPERSAKPLSAGPDYGWNEVMTLLSDDNGETWRASPQLLNIEIDGSKATRYGAIEPDVIQLKNSALWMLIRTNNGTFYESFSQDSGESWTAPKPSKFVSSDSPASFLRLKDGRIILFFNMNQRWDNPNSYAFGGREVLHAAITADEGKTWKGFREVLKEDSQKAGKEKGDRGTAYPSAVETSDGKVILVSGQGESKSIVLFDPDWLKEKSVRVTKEEIENELSENPEWVRNFPAAQKGEIEVKLDLRKNSPAMRIALTDHFSIPADSLASARSVFVFNFTPESSLEGINTLKIKWNSDQKKVSFYLNNRLFAGSALLKTPVFGLNYLRIATLSDSPENGNRIRINEFSYNQIP